MLTTLIDTLMSAEADPVCGAGYGHRPLDQGPALPGRRRAVLTVREGGRVVNVHALVAEGRRRPG